MPAPTKRDAPGPPSAPAAEPSSDAEAGGSCAEALAERGPAAESDGGALAPVEAAARPDPPLVPVKPSKRRPNPVIRFVHRVFPWASLAVGIYGAIMMDRTPKRGAIVAVVTVASWAVFPIVLWLGRRRDRAGTMVRGVHATTMLISQSSIHLQLYFALPFYFAAFAGTAAQLVFIAVLGACALASLWDPLTEWLLLRARFGLALPALSSFAVLAAVLPGLGVSNGGSLWLAAAGAGLGLPLWVVIEHVRGEPLLRPLAVALALAGVIPSALWLGAARAVPAVPLELRWAEIGTRLNGRELADPRESFERVPASMVCATAIYAPFGVRDELQHVWRKDGVIVDRIGLDIRGGREGGFRTWSIKHNFGDEPNGEWSCAIETEMGQFLGEKRVVVGP